jgi:CrcB protein
VAAGGALGALARYGVQLLGARLTDSPFPAAILAVNAAGSAAIGLLAGAMAAGRLTIGPDARLFLVIGILGGFTTFSSFSLDTLLLIRAGHVGLAVLNVAGHVGLGLMAVYVGFRLGS